jgi:hypothetical protein
MGLEMRKLAEEQTIEGKRTWFADGDGGLVIRDEQNVAPILEANKAAYNQIDERARWGDGARVAEIPNSVIADLNVKGIMRGFAVVDQKRMKAFLNDPENRFLRTRPGRI